MDETEQRIRERAYQLWEQDGRPDGGAEHYWNRAERELGAPPDAQADAAVDTTVEDTFPASDPPSFTPTGGSD